MNEKQENDRAIDGFVVTFPANKGQHLEELHHALHSAGQTLSDDEMPAFLFSKHDKAGRLIAGCKGEIAFKHAHISELWVHNSLRGQGVGTSLLKVAEDFAVEQGCNRIHLETRNETARRLYEKLGYSIFGELENYQAEQSFYYLVKTL